MTTVNLLQAFPDVAEHYRRRFRHVLVDEYQDTNHAQYMLVRELVAGGDPALGVPPAELCVVGDADQSIYAFRGATIRNILDFEKDYPDATTILLEQNYRSTQTILSAANAVISRNASRKPKNLWSDAGEGAPIVGYVADNEHDEASFVASEVDRLTDEDGVLPSHVAVFYRTNAQSRVFEEVFIRVGLPYKVVGGVRFYERREVRDALAYLRVLANPADTVVAAPHPQRPQARHRRPRRGLHRGARAARGASPSTRRCSRCEDAYGMADSVAGGGSGVPHACSTTCARWSRRAPGRRRSSRRSSSAPATPPSCRGPPIRRTRPGWRTSRSSWLSPASSRRPTPTGTLVDFMETVALVADADEIPDEELVDGQPRRAS